MKLANRVALLIATAVGGVACVLTVLALQPLFAEPATRPASAVILPKPRPVKTTAIPRTTSSTVWVFGDSISGGQGLPASQAWPVRLAARTGTTMVNFSKPGYAFSGYLGNISDELATAYASGQPVPATVIVAAGSNDLPIHDSQSLIASEFAALAVRDSLMQHGAKRVLFVAVVPRGDGYEQLRQQLNLWMAITFADNYQAVDFFLNPPSSSLFAKYYQLDRLHPNAVGAQLIADTFDATKVVR